MRPVQIKDSNANFVKPSNWDDQAFGACGDLPIRREVMGVAGNAYMAHFSNWKPNADELRALNAGGVVQLECCGLQPAVSVGVVESAEEGYPPLPFPFAEIRGAVARGWCADANVNKEMDTVLGEAIAIEVAKMFGAPPFVRVGDRD